MEIKAASASNGGVPVYRSGRSSLLDPLATMRDLICMGFSSNASGVNPLRVDRSDLLDAHQVSVTL